MNCIKHPENQIIGVCSNCGDFICKDCSVKNNNRNFCLTCLPFLNSEQQCKKVENKQSISASMKFLFYFLSLFFIPGIIIGAIYYNNKNDEEIRRIGKKCLIISTFILLFYLLFSSSSSLNQSLSDDSIEFTNY